MGVEFLWIGGAVLFSAFLRGLTGFGFAMAAVPLMAVAVSPLRAVTLTVILQLAIGIFDLFRNAEDYDRRELGLLGLGAAFGLPLGMAGLLLMSPAGARIGIAAVSLCGLLLSLRRPKVQLRPAAPVTALVGLLSGVFSGLAAMPGPPAVAYFIASGVPARRVRSSLIVFFLIAAVLTLPGLIWAGAIDQQALVIALACWPLLILGSRAGRMVFLRMGEGQYRSAAIAMMALSTVLAGWRGLIDLI